VIAPFYLSFDCFPRIGPGLVERIVAFSASNGPVAFVDELLEAAGSTRCCRTSSRVSSS
jgi:hypothetical protein